MEAVISPAACCHSGGSGGGGAGAAGSEASHTWKPSTCRARAAAAAPAVLSPAGVLGGPADAPPAALVRVSTAAGPLAARGTVLAAAPGSISRVPPQRSSAASSTGPLAALTVPPNNDTSPLSTASVARPANTSACAWAARVKAPVCRGAAAAAALHACRPGVAGHYPAIET